MTPAELLEIEARRRQTEQESGLEYEALLDHLAITDVPKLLAAVREAPHWREIAAQVAGYTEHEIGCPGWYRQFVSAERIPDVMRAAPCDCGLGELLAAFRRLGKEGEEA